MRNSTEIIFAISLFIPLLMGALSLVLFKEHREKQYSHLSEFWGSMLFNVVVMMTFIQNMTSVAALSMVGWIWSLRTFKLVMEDLSASKHLNRYHYVFLFIAGFISFALGGYKYSFVLTTLPFSVAVGGLGLFVTYRSYQKAASDNLSPLHLTSYVLFGLFFALKLSFPFWRLNPYFMDVGMALEIIFLSGFAGVGLATSLDMQTNKHSFYLKQTLKDRSEKFLGQSKFSELGMMSAGIAHEINNPLAVIQARTTQLLRIYKNPEKQKELADGLQQILYTSERINKTIQGVRDFVHQDGNAPSSEMNLKDLFDDVLAFCGQRMKNHGVNLRFYGLEKYKVSGHKIQLEQVILNLLNNSFDAIEFLSDKWIEVSCQQKDDHIQLFFKDSGLGIPPEIASRMMEPFFSTKDIGKGTGLGLALAKGIVEKHGGTLEYLENCPHTTFLMQLPKTPAHDWNAESTQPLH